MSRDSLDGGLAEASTTKLAIVASKPQLLRLYVRMEASLLYRDFYTEICVARMSGPEDKKAEIT